MADAMIILRFTIAILAMAMVLVTVTASLRVDYWWVRVLDFPRLQFAMAGIFIAGLYTYWHSSFRIHDYAILALLIISVGYQINKVIPYTIFMPKQVLSTNDHTDGSNIRLLIINVLMDNRNSEEFKSIVQHYDPDMILVIEPDDWWEESLRSIEKEYPYTIKHPLDNTFGMIVYSRLTINDPETLYILKDEIPSMHMRVSLPSKDQVFIHFVHPSPPNPKYATDTTKRDAEILIVGREVKSRGGPTIVAGDFNDVPWSYTTRLFQKTSALLDPRIGRGLYNTYNATIPIARWPLDHAFHSDHFKLIHMETGPSWGSDHYPLFVELSLDPEEQSDQEAPESDQTEKQAIDEKIEDGKMKEDN